MKLGISSYSFTWAVGVKGSLPEQPLDETDLLNLAAELGTGLVQLSDNLPLHELSAERIGRLSREASGLGIRLEAGAAGLNDSHLERYIFLSEAIGADLLRFSIDGKDYQPDLDTVIPILKNAVPELKKRGITLALENHDRLLVHEFRDLMETVASPWVGICLDCANSLGVGEGFREVVLALAPYAVNFHLKEVYIRRKYHMMGFDVEGRPFGEGCLPLQWMLSQLPASCKTAILEQWTPPEDTLEKTIAKERDWAERSISYLKDYFDA